MSNKDNGGPAFPVSDVMALDPRTTAEMVSLAHGMTLRDYFAANAMQWLANGDYTWQSLAEDSYAIADAMLEARNQ